MKCKIGIITVVVLVVVLATGCGNSINQFTTTTLNNFNGANSASSSSTNGLSLSLSLDSKTYQPGQEISIVVDIKNTRSRTNDVPISNDWSYNQLASGQCDMGLPYGIAVFHGDYTSSDFSTATPLALWNYNFIVPCGIPMTNTAYDFNPLSDMANPIDGTSSQNYSFAIDAEFTETGYWTGAAPNATMHNFDPGVYTVVAGDEWGALLVVHFTVSQ
jgi:hypothetical protein